MLASTISQNDAASEVHKADCYIGTILALRLHQASISRRIFYHTSPLRILWTGTSSAALPAATCLSENSHQRMEFSSAEPFFASHLHAQVLHILEQLIPLRMRFCQRRLQLCMQ